MIDKHIKFSSHIEFLSIIYNSLLFLIMKIYNITVESKKYILKNRPKQFSNLFTNLKLFVFKQ